MRQVIDGTAVAIDDAALLLLGPSGAGKSDLALRLIDAGARLICDDRVEVTADDAGVWATPPADLPPNLRGRIEVRGLGIAPVAFTTVAVRLHWAVELVAAAAIERLPAAESRRILGYDVPLLRLDPFAASAAAKLRLAVRCGPGLIMGRE